MAGILKETGIDYPLRVPGVTPVFDEVRVANRFSFVHCGFSFIFY
jgi:hypothetical protein